MLADKNDLSALLGTKNNEPSSSDNAARNSNLQINNEKVASSEIYKSKEKKKKKKKRQESDTQFTSVLKFFNIIIGIIVVGFGGSCYYFFNTEKKQGGVDFMGLILPAYISVSGLLILLIECNIGFIIRNMRFLYNYFGRGFFNIYVGVMPLSMIRTGDPSQSQLFQIIVYIMVSLMCLIGILYICAKIFCCAKEEDKRKKKRKYSSESESSGND